MGSITSSLGIPKTNCGHKEPSQWCALFSDTSTETKCLAGQQSAQRRSFSAPLPAKHTMYELSTEASMCLQPPPPRPSALLCRCLAVNRVNCVSGL